MSEEEYISPIALNKNEVRRARDKWQQVVGQYPRPYATLLKTTETSFPFRVEMNEAGKSRDAEVLRMLYHTSRLLPRYAFPVGLNRAIGYNGLPRGVSGEIAIRYSPEDGEKYYWFEHAERNAIYNAARAGTSTAGCRLYVSLFPCADCASAIIQSGVVQVNTYSRADVEDKVKKRSFDVASTMFEEARIELLTFAEQPADRGQRDGRTD